jgi:ribonuclease P protein component
MALRLLTLKDQSEFNAINAKGVKYNSRSFVCVCATFPSAQDQTLYLGLKAGKKLGNAVLRNKIRRRFKSLIRERVATNSQHSSLGFIIIPKFNSHNTPYANLIDEVDGMMCFFEKRIPH